MIDGLVSRPGTPAAAYPPPVAAGIPGPWLFCPVAVLLLAVLAVATYLGWRCYQRHRGGVGRDHVRWADARDERRLAVPADRAGSG